MRNKAVRFTVAVAFAAIGLSAGVGGPALAQERPDVTATIVPVPASTTPGTTVEVTAVFTPNVTLPNYRVAITLTGTNGEGTIDATVVSASSGLSSCVLGAVQRSISCDWVTNTDVEQTLVVTVNVGDGATPSTQSWEVTASAGPVTPLETLARAYIEILPAPTTTTTIPPTTTIPATTSTVATAPTTTIDGGAGAPTTTVPVVLPETGADTTMLALLALVVLMAGGAAVAVARRTS